jgi:hypothetical protein
MDELGCLPGLPPGGMRKHRTRQRAMRAAFMLFSLLHLTIGAFLVYEKCFLGWHVIGFTFVSSQKVHKSINLKLRSLHCRKSSKSLFSHELLNFLTLLSAVVHSSAFCCSGNERSPPRAAFLEGSNSFLLLWCVT